MLVPNDVFKLLTETWNGILAERDALRTEVETLRAEIETLRQRETERIRFASLPFRQQRRITSERLSDLYDRLTQLLNESIDQPMPVDASRPQGVAALP
jgi:predicted nuclease with TOPRIM domain